jgi:predicted ribosomally synthesized peptide with nif11-like leader
MNEKLVELLKDEAFVKELVAQETPEDAQKFLASKGVEVSAEELENIRKEILARIDGNEEMNDEQLEQVAGGSVAVDVVKFGVDCIIKVGDCVHTLTRGRW